jgi:hypothetical protein
MAISYNVYANDGLGGVVDYTTPIATTANLTFALGPLAIPSDNIFGVRAFDNVSGIEEANTNAWIRIVIDPSGNDVTARPNAVVGLSASPTAGGTCWVSWGYDATGQGGAPVQFHVFLSTGATASLASPVATVAYLPGVSGYSCSLTGLAGNTLSTIAVQAVGASSDLVGGVKTVAITYQVNPLSNVDSLVAIPSA